MSTVKKLMKGSVSRSLETGVAIVAGVITMPVMMSQLGPELYGLWILIGGFIASLYLFDFGFASSVTKYVGEAIHRGDIERSNQVVNSALVIYFGLAVAIVVFACGVAALAPWMMDDHSRLGLVRVLIVLTGTSIAVEFPGKAYTGIATAFLRFDLIAYSRMVFKILSTVVLVTALYAGQKLITVALIFLISNTLSTMVFVAIAYHLYPNLRLRSSYFDRDLIRQMGGYSAWAFLIDISRLVKRKGDIFVIGALMAAPLLAIYYVAVRLTEFSIQLLTNATNITMPLFLEQLSQARHQEIRQTILIFTRLNVIAALLVLTCFIAAGQPLITLWIGPDFDANLAHQVLVILFLGQAVNLITMPLHSLIMANGTHQRLALITVCEPILSVACMLFFVQGLNFGLVGVAGGASLPFLLTRLLVLPVLAERVLSLPWRKLMQSVSVPLMIFVVSTIAGLSLGRVWDNSHWWGLLGVGSGTALLFILLNLLFLKDYEKRYIAQAFKSKLRNPQTR